MNKTITFVRFPFSSRLGGEEIHTIKLAEYFRRQGYQVRLISNCQVLESLFKKSSFEVFKFKAPKPPVTKLSVLTFALSYLAFLYRFKRQFDVSFFKNEAATFLLNLGEKITLSSYLSQVSQKVFFLELARLANWIFKNPFLHLLRKRGQLKNVQVVSVAKIMIEPIWQAYKVKPVIIANSLYLEDFELDDKEGNSDNSLYKIQRIGFMGRFTEDKGREIIISLAKGLPEVEFKVTASAIPHSPKNINFVGKILASQRAEFYKDLDLFILPATLIDPYGLVVLEAMVNKVPVLASNMVGACDYFKKDQEMFCEPVESFQEKILELKNQPALLNSVTKQAYKKVLSKTSDKMHQEFLKLLED